ncbi:hypothetical protein DXD68_20030 [Parabacteroides sp. TM07-1AC]|uniref:hypothetical protein n=1 Tax=Parabacteroides sp. TM07-1AC TaxID=2292363 RepID=UPI000EFFC97E|nr:hypothetical protein [Parabacteroides sp. TM07-1AC]RHU23364.1 hypothetical protein DXD68_20030 [Parabacteroides sp. TM07-1AC]
MKAINRLSVLFFLFIAVACSSEDDILDGVETKAPDNNIEAEAYAEFEFSLSTGTTQTRSSVEEDGESDPNEDTTEASLSSCYIAVIDESDNVIASDFYSTYNSGDFGWSKIDGKNYPTLKKHITIKVHNGENPKLRFFAIANLESNVNSDGTSDSDKDGFMQCTTWNGIQNNLIKSHINIFVKQGSYELPAGENLILKEDVSKHDDRCNKILIPVYQVTSAVLLESFKIRRAGQKDGVEELGRVKSVELVNLKNKTYLNPDRTVEDDGDNYDKVAACGVGDDYTFNRDYKDLDYYPDHVNPKYESIKQIRFYTYRNETSLEERKTALKIVYTLEEGGAEYTKVIKIKSPGNAGPVEKVEAGKLYKLYVTVSETSVDINFKVADWIPNTIDLGEIEGIIK